MNIYYVLDSGYHVGVFEVEVTRATTKLYYIDYKNAKLVFGGGYLHNSQINRGSLCFLLECDAISKARLLIDSKIDHLQEQIERWQKYEGSF